MIDILKKELEELGFHVRLRNRKLKYKRKTYLNVKGTGDHGTFCFSVMLLIKECYPDSYISSGGFYCGTFNMTVALEK